MEGRLLILNTFNDDWAVAQRVVGDVLERFSFLNLPFPNFFFLERLPATRKKRKGEAEEEDNLVSEIDLRE